ncbi:MAG: NADH dehydrogenase [Bacteroidetes bacterium]|nr:MAG: NADH dehydrogenase [Bacteroidota bacterium]
MLIDVPVVSLPRVVIVGGGFAGIQLVKHLHGKFQVVLIDKTNFHTFQPLLYQVATAGIEPDSIVFPLRKLFKGYRHFHFRMATATGIKRNEKTLCTSIGDIRYDYLVIAAGSDTNYFGMEKLMANSMPMKSVSEALDLRSCILQNFEKALITSDPGERERLMTYVIAGGGPTGVELAGALAELKRHVLPKDYPELDFRQMEIHLVEGAPRVLAAMDKISSEKSQGFLEKLGVYVWTNMRVTDYDGKTVTANGEKRFETSTLIWAAGVSGNTLPGLDPKNARRDGRIPVDEFCRVKETDSIFAVGDIAYMEEQAWPSGHPMVAQVAIQMGKLAAENIIRSAQKKTMKAFAYKNKGSMATIGRNKAVAEIKNWKSQGFIAWMIWMFVHLMSIVGFRNRVVVLFNWVISYLNYDRGMRLIIRPFRSRKEQKEHGSNQ